MQELASAEQKLLQKYFRLRNVYILMLTFLLFLASGYGFFVWKYFIPAYVTPFDKVPNAQEFIKGGLISLVRFSMFWIFLAACVVVGNFIAYLRIRTILRKLLSTKSLPEHASLKAPPTNL